MPGLVTRQRLEQWSTDWESSSHLEVRVQKKNGFLGWHRPVFQFTT